ncbi:MAG: hypothetical protein V7751_22140 [Pseudoalteromonas distincta]
MFNDKTEDFHYTFELSKTDLQNIGDIQHYLSCAGLGDYDEDAYSTVCADCYLDFNAVVQEALESTANMYKQMAWEAQRRQKLEDNATEGN